MNTSLCTMTKEEIAYATEWLMDIQHIFSNLDEDDIRDMFDFEIEFAVKRYFDGGVESFKESCK